MEKKAEILYLLLCVMLTFVSSARSPRTVTSLGCTRQKKCDSQVVVDPLRFLSSQEKAMLGQRTVVRFCEACRRNLYDRKLQSVSTDESKSTTTAPISAPISAPTTHQTAPTIEDAGLTQLQQKKEAEGGSSSTRAQRITIDQPWRG